MDSDEIARVGTQTMALYVEIEKIAKKKPSELVPPLIRRKINRVIEQSRSVVDSDIFLDDIDSLPVEGFDVRYDEALIVTAELRSVLAAAFTSETGRRPLRW